MTLLCRRVTQQGMRGSRQADEETAVVVQRVTVARISVVTEKMERGGRLRIQTGM